MIPNLHSGINLENRLHPAIIETKRIIIPEHPDAFNPSIIYWRGSLLLSFRELSLIETIIPLPIYSSGFSRIGLVFLNEDFSTQGSCYTLKLPKGLTRSEDARLINIDERLYLIYSDNVDSIVTEEGFKMYVAELDFDGQHFFFKTLEVLTDFPGSNYKKREKNWVPFAYENHLLLAYSLLPHHILEPLLDGSQTCDLIATSRANINWKWGELRGGTPAIRVGDEYLAFFHSSIYISSDHSKQECMPHYFMGAYTFKKDPPFSITKISKNPIIGKDFYNGATYPYYWKPVQVVFPCGILDDDEYIWITYGRQDHELWIAKIDKQKLLQSLIKIPY